MINEKEYKELIKILKGEIENMKEKEKEKIRRKIK